MTPYKLGAVGMYGKRGIVKGYALIADVPISTNQRIDIEQRRADRDAMAQKIVDALNASEKETA